jgi:hypothetical protein
MGGGGGEQESKSVTTYRPAISYMPQAMQNQYNQVLSGYANMPTSIPIRYGGGTFQMGSRFPALGAQIGTQLYSPQTAGQVQKSSSWEAPTFCGMSCFLFIESADDKELNELRAFRDTHFPRGSIVQKGYEKLSRLLIPLMRKSKLVRNIVGYTMVKPLIAFARWYYGKNRYGRMFYPLAWMWRNIWWLCGEFLPVKEYTWAEFYDLVYRP